MEGNEVDQVNSQILTSESRNGVGPNGFKSSAIGRNWKRRRIISEDITQLNFRYISVIIDKRHLDPQSNSGLMYRRIFHKYFSKMLFSKLSTYAEKTPDKEVQVFVDRYGRETFQNEFKKYIDHNFKPSLFNQQNLYPTFVNSKDVPGIRLADFVAGTWRLMVEQSEDSSSNTERTAIREIFRKREEYAFRWPKWSGDTEPIPTNEFDSVILERNIELSLDFLRDNERSDDKTIQAQCEVLRCLLFSQALGPLQSGSPLYAASLITAIEDADLGQYNEQSFRRNILNPLRDSGIIITGHSSGIKIATGMNDISEFINQTDLRIGAQLQRLKRTEEAILSWTSNSIWEGDSHSALCRAMNQYCDEKRGLP